MLIFADIQGQERPLKALKRAIASEKLAHGYLFSGPLGVGKASSAEAFALALNCQREKGIGCRDDSEDCCDSCRKFHSGNHPDILRLEPEGQFIKVDQVRALEQRLRFPPHEAFYRLVLIDGAERLNLNGANALLKSVEEPRPGTIFILITSAIQRVIPTLISRCQRLHFSPLTTETLTQILNHYSDHDLQARQSAAQCAEGSPGRAIALLENDGLAAAQHTANQLLHATQHNSFTLNFEVVADAGREKDHLKQVFDLLRLRLRDELLSHAGLNEQTTTSSFRGLKRQLDALHEAEEALLRNVNVNLLLETLVFKLQQDIKR